MQTKITVFHAPAQGLQALPDRSVDLVVTSPPYPMIGMWDECFAGQDPMIGKALSSGDAAEAFSRMHAILDQVWAACTRVLVEGGFACINIADATRTFDGHFRLFPPKATCSAHWAWSVRLQNVVCDFGMMPNVRRRCGYLEQRRRRQSGVWITGAIKTIVSIPCGAATVLTVSMRLLLFALAARSTGNPLHRCGLLPVNKRIWIV